MLYEFAGTNDGELAVSLGEFVYLVDDDGSGWALMMNVSLFFTRCRQRGSLLYHHNSHLSPPPPSHHRQNNGQQGYVPASYYRVV